MEWRDNRSKTAWRTAVALSTAAVIVAGVIPSLEARASSPDAQTTATSGAGARRVKVGGAVRPPRKVVDARPEYPQNARDAKIQGVVILEIVIGENGAVIDTKILRSIPELDQPAIDAVRQWIFEPTLLNGEPVEVEMTVTINFSLQ
jgi:protein TonB